MRRWIPAIAIVALLAAGLLLIRPAPDLGIFSLADGTKFEVAKITTGPVHRYRYDNRWQDYLAYVLPKALRAKLNPHILELTETNANSLVFWTKSRSQPPMIPGFQIAVEDGSGIEAVGGVGPFGRTMLPTTMRVVNSNLFVAGWLVAPLPHHAPEIGVTFYESQRRVGHFKLPNPAYRRARHVSLDNLPLEKSAGDVRVKLFRVDASRNWQNTSRVDWAVSAQVMRDGEQLSDWQVDAVAVLADGELLTQTQPAWWFQLREPGLAIRSQGPSFPGPWPEAVWTLRLWAAQRFNFTLGELWILNDVPVTNAVEWTIEKHEQRQVGGKKVELLGYRGPQVTTSGPGFSGRSMGGRPGEVWVCFAAPPRTQDIRITFLSARDDQGRTLDRASQSYGLSRAPWAIPSPATGQPAVMIYGFSVRPAPDAKSLTFEFAVHQARSAEFVVKPAFEK